MDGNDTKRAFGEKERKERVLKKDTKQRERAKGALFGVYTPLTSVLARLPGGFHGHAQCSALLYSQQPGSTGVSQSVSHPVSQNSRSVVLELPVVPLHGTDIRGG
ncbi:hypothetical protein V1477_014296 [Vespula maculifrons]|uniref:Uncharacterized protein n=1 Tax=Vespula maculifrons TaxID=7453 RepID=A0ABD2BKM9_VESMC